MPRCTEWTLCLVAHELTIESLDVGAMKESFQHYQSLAAEEAAAPSPRRARAPPRRTAVPARLGKSRGGVDAILLRARRRPQDTISGWVVATVLSALATGYLLSRLLRESQRHAVRDRVQSMLRNLQTGVIQIDEEDNIMEANDQAEELQGEPLPRFGDETGSEYRKPFQELIDPLIVESSPGGLLTVSRYQQSIPPKRQAGITSEYYARLVTARRSGEWLRIRGLPMFFVNASGTAMSRDPKTFGVLERVDRKEERDAVEAQYRRAVSALFSLSAPSREIEPVNDLGQQLLRELAPDGHKGPISLEGLIADRLLLD